MTKKMEMRLLLDFPVTGDDFEGDVVLIRDGVDKPVSLLPGDSLNIGLSAHPSGKASIEINLTVDFQEPFSSDAIVVRSVIGNVKYMK